MRKSFTWFLSLMVLLTAFATFGYAQEEQETVELYAEVASGCYNEANDYTVTISVRDFIQLSHFELDLDYNEAVFGYLTSSNANPSLSAGISVTETAGVISIDWTGSPTTIGDNLKTAILKLHFSVLGYPGNTAPSFTSPMAWTTWNFWYAVPNAPYEDAVNTVIKTNGSLAVNVSMTGIETEMTAETCFGGEATVTVTAPAAAMFLFNEDVNPANWAWTSSPEYLAAAGETVTIRVKAANGCISLKSEVVIPETIDPVAFTVTTQDPACYGGKGSVVINATGGTAPYSYYISVNDDGTGAVSKGNFQFSMAPGTYYVNVQDVNGCADLEWEEITIVDENDILEVGATPTDVMCYGAATGKIATTVVSGNLTMVSLDGVVWKTLPYTFNNLAAGTYNVQAKNANGCMVTLKGVVVAQPSAPITFKIKIDDTSCGGDNDGVITVIDVMGGTAPYQYSLDGSSYDTVSVITDLEPTYYSLWVRDANGCVVQYNNPNGTGNTIAVQSPDDIMYDVVITDPLCNDENAKITITNVTGGTGAWIYSFDGGSTWSTSVKTMNWAAPYAGVTIWVANPDSTCPVEQTVDYEDVDNPETLYADIHDELAPTCINGNDGNITLHIWGGTLPYYYSINGSDWRMTTKEYTNIKVNVGTHTIMVKDANGCEYNGEGDLDVTITLEESIIEATSDTHIDCFGSKTGTISVDFTSWAEGLDGDAPYRDVKYYVKNGAGQITSFNPSNQGGTATLFNAGTYTIWVVDQYTCISNSDTAVVTQNDELLIADVTSNGASCFESFEGNITIYATGGNTDELEYAIVNNEGALGNITDDKWLPFDTYDDEVSPALSTVSFQVDGGTYWIAVRDDDCDEVTYGPIVVEGYTELLVDEDEITSTDPLCYESEDGTITVPMSAVTGGAGSYKFTLLQYTGSYQTEEVGMTLKSNTIGNGGWIELEDYIDQTTGIFTGLAAGTYMVLVEDAMDCPSYTTEEIVLEDPEMLSFETEFWHMSCENANDGIITIDVSGGTPDYWYAINNMNTWVAFGAGKTSKTYIATEPGTFTIWVKDANGCVTEPVEVTILEPTALSATVNVVQNVSCNGGSDGIISVVGIGGWEGMSMYQFKVNNGSWTSSTTISGLAVGTHTLYIRDVNSYSEPYQDLDCVYSRTFTITQPAKITYDVVIADVKCKDGEDGTFTVNVQSGGTPWDVTGTINDGYDVKLTGDNYDSGWKRTGADKSHTFAGLAHSHYTVYIKDSKNCMLGATIGNIVAPYTTIESWEVAEPDSYLEFEAMWLKNATCFESEDGEIKVVASGGTAPYKYYAGLSIPPNGGGHILVPAPPANSDKWSDSDILMVGAGTWVIWVMDSNGCIIGGETDGNGVPVNEWRVKVLQPAQVMWAFHMVGSPAVVHYLQPKCNGDWNGEIHLVNITGGSGVYNAHVWGKSATGVAVDKTYNNITLSGALYKLGGVPASDEDGFSVTVTDSKGCTSDVDDIFVDQPDALTVSLQESPDNYSCFGAVEGWIEATADGGTGTYQYQLKKNGVVHTPWQSIASAFLVQVGNTFVVEVKDANGCTVASDPLWMPTPLKVAFSYEDLTCHGAEKPSVTITATGTPGREFRVHYKQIEDQPVNAPFITYNGWFTESITIGDVFEYDNENYTDLHYAVYVEDEKGCMSAVDTLTFDQVQTPLTVVMENTDVTECSETVSITSVVGGVAPYVLMIDDMVMTEMTNTLARGEHTIKVMDAHMCSVEEMVEVVGVYVTRDTTIETYIDEETAYVDVEADLDTMLAVGTHQWVYMNGDCERTLNVTVVEVPRPYTIAEVQGDGATSPVVDKIAKVTGTVTGVVSGAGFFMQDASAAWSGIYVAYTTGGVAIGDGVSVVGTVAEVNAVTTIVATEVMAATGTPVITPVAVTPTGAEAEMYESVLVKVLGARATAADAGSGEWTIYTEESNNAIVNHWLYAYTPVEGDFYNVTGIVNGKLDAYKLEPRMESDIVNVTTTKVDIIGANAFKVYPNPFNEQITIDNYEKLTRVVVSNIAGQRVIDIEYPTREIRTANLVSGIYVISLFTEDGIAKTERMIKR